MVNVYSAKLDVIVPLSGTQCPPKRVGGWVSREFLAKFDEAMARHMSSRFS